MSEFIYLYRRPAAPPASPQQMQKTMERWQTWIADLEKKGHLVARGEPLDTRGGAVVRDAKATVTDGPYAETKDIVVGFTLIAANDLEQALALTKGCPVFDQGGMIEVRPIMKM